MTDVAVDLKSNRQLVVAMLGLRSIEGAQGGVETHVRHLTRELARQGARIVILGRAPYVPASASRSGAVRTVRLWAPANVSLEALLHTFVGVLYAAILRPNILHIHAVGPGLMVPLARLLGLRVVFTHHGEDYAREKWGRFARFTLATGETLASRSASQVICISNHLKSLVDRKYRRIAHLIPNGVSIPTGDSPETLPGLGLEPHRYILTVGRLVPEKRQLDLIAAFRRIQDRFPAWRVAVVGKADHESEYARSVAAAAAESPGTIMCDFQYGAALAELYRRAGAFALISSHEGHPIAMLEAMAFNLPIVASDIPANLEIDLPPECYVPMGSIDRLADRLAALMAAIDAGAESPDWSAALRRYDWGDIAKSTRNVYDLARR